MTQRHFKPEIINKRWHVMKRAGRRWYVLCCVYGVPEQAKRLARIIARLLNARQRLLDVLGVPS